MRQGEVYDRWTGRALLLRDRSRHTRSSTSGGTEAEFAKLWAHVEETNIRQREAVQAGTFDRPGARTMYLVSARK
jgi:hypothetical protein